LGSVIDSSVFVAAERGKLDLSVLPSDDAIAIAAITVSELLHGVHRAAPPARKAVREAFVERILGSFPVVAFDTTIARVHGRIWADLAARGTAVGTHDLLIAATAESLGYSVATRDLRSFPRIPGLRVVKV